jgi:uncharacterized protein
MTLTHSWLSPKAHAKQSKSHGNGVFALEDIAKGERIAVFGGDIMLIDEIDSLPAELQDYPMQIEDRFVIGSRTNKGPENTDFFNHSCDPNAGIKGQIFLVAMRNIAKGEEITFDYAMTVAESDESDIVFEMNCECGSPKCRKIITENDWKSPELQTRYSGFFSQYIQEKIDAMKK